MRTLGPGEQPRADETVSEFQNQSAHVIHVSIGDGAFITVPPTVGAATVRIALTATEKTGLDAGLATTAAQQWITACELVVVAAPPPPEGGGEEGGEEGGVVSRSRRGPADDDDDDA